MDSLFERCRNNKLIFTKLRPQTSPEHTSNSRSMNHGGSRNSGELEEVFNRRNSTAATGRILSSNVNANRRRTLNPSAGGDGGASGELDSDLDDARSDFGSEIYSQVSGISRRSPKLNRLVDLIQSEKPAAMAQSGSPGENKKESPKVAPGTPNTTLVPNNESSGSVASPKLNLSTSTSRVNKLCGTFYWNLLTITSVALGFILTELVLKQSVKLLQFLKVTIERAGTYMWSNFLAPIGTTEAGERKPLLGQLWTKPGPGGINVDNMLTMVLVVPAVILLAFAYGIVWILYFLNVVLLMEIPLF